MRVLSFTGFSKTRPPAKGRDWSQQEIADFYRAHRLLVENGAGIGIDRGVTDIGEPWMVFYDLMTQDVFMHVARIDENCLLICETFGIKLSAANIADLIIKFEIAVRDHFAVRTEANSNVILHPAAKIILSISAIFLLFKLDGNGAAYAKNIASAEQATSLESVKKNDVTPFARAQSALTRLFETMDSPRAVASLAGAILTGELLINLQSSQHDAEPAHLSAQSFIALPEVVAPASGLIGAEDRPVSEITHAEAAVSEPGIHRAMLPGVVVAANSDSGEQKHIFEGSSVNEILTLSLSSARNQTIEETVAVANLRNNVVSQDAIVKPAAQEGLETSNSTVPEAVKALQTILGQSFQEISKEAILTVTWPQAEEGNVKNDAIALSPKVEVSLATLDHLDNSVGFFMQTSFSDEGLRELLLHFMSSMGVYEVEYSGGKVLIEQNDISDLIGGDIGVWTNVMSDGSTISVVGQASLIDDVANYIV